MNDEATTYQNLIRDVVYLVREEAANAGSSSEFERGREFGLRQALAWMQHEAIAFAVDREALLLDGFDAMVDPVRPPLRTLPDVTR